MSRRSTASLAVFAAAALVGSTLPSAAEFFGWQVVNVASWDVLNVRAYPSPVSQVLVGYANGTALSLTGKCTAGLKLDAINGKPKWQQMQADRFHWCEVWVDPMGDGNFRSGWVYGKFIAPL